MKLWVKPQAWIDMRLFIENAKKEDTDSVKEISWLGVVEQTENNDIYLSEVFLVKQDCSGAHSDMDDDALHSLLTELVTGGREEVIPKLSFWGHSHAQMGAYFSTTDTTTISEWTGNWLVSFVMNLKGEYKVRLDIFKPFQVTVEPLEVEMAWWPTEEDTERVKAAIAEHVSFPSWSSSSQGGYGRGTRWDFNAKEWVPIGGKEEAKAQGEEALAEIQWRVGQCQVGRRRTKGGLEFYWWQSGGVLSNEEVEMLHHSNKKEWAQAQFLYSTRTHKQGDNPYNYRADRIVEKSVSSEHVIDLVKRDPKSQRDLDFDALAFMYGYKPLPTNLAADLDDPKITLGELLSLEAGIDDDLEALPALTSSDGDLLLVLSLQVGEDIKRLREYLQMDDVGFQKLVGDVMTGSIDALVEDEDEWCGVDTKLAATAKPAEREAKKE